MKRIPASSRADLAVRTPKSPRRGAWGFDHDALLLRVFGRSRLLLLWLRRLLWLLLLLRCRSRSLRRSLLLLDDGAVEVGARRDAGCCRHLVHASALGVVD